MEVGARWCDQSFQACNKAGRAMLPEVCSVKLVSNGSGGHQQRVFPCSRLRRLGNWLRHRIYSRSMGAQHTQGQTSVDESKRLQPRTFSVLGSWHSLTESLPRSGKLHTAAADHTMVYVNCGSCRRGRFPLSPAGLCPEVECRKQGQSLIQQQGLSGCLAIGNHTCLRHKLQQHRPHACVTHTTGPQAKQGLLTYCTVQA